MEKFRLVLAVFVTLTLVGCATSSNVVVNPGAARSVESAYVVLHQGNSSDMDAHIQRELMAHGVRVVAGSDVQRPETDVVVRYNDNWRWDITMYLRSLDIQMYDATSGSLMASGSWKNSAMHGYHGAEGVVKKVVDEIFARLRGVSNGTASGIRKQTADPAGATE